MAALVKVVVVVVVVVVVAIMMMVVVDALAIAGKTAGVGWALAATQELTVRRTRTVKQTRLKYPLYPFMLLSERRGGATTALG